MTDHGFTAGSLAERLGGSLRNCPEDRPIREASPLGEAGAEALSFVAGPKYRDQGLASGAGLILARTNLDLEDRPVLQVAQPQATFAQAVGLLHPEPPPEWCAQAIHPTAQVDPTALLHPTATVGARCVVGPGCILHPGVRLGADCVLGEGCELFDGVVLYRRTRLENRVRIHANAVLGADGYGYTLSEGRHLKIPQVGWVEVGDDVEIGAGTTIDRGALGPTRIGRGTKIDNLCQIAHNAQIGEHCLIVAQTGLSGSVTLGDYVTLAGKVGVIDHIAIGARAIVGGASVVAKDVPEDAFVTGYPARPHRQWMASQAALGRLPEFMKQARKVRED